MKVHSIFNSISGEIGNIPQGTFTTFIRLAGCNLRCHYCDTPKTWTDTDAQDLTITDILQAVKTIGCYHVLVTGGEPLLQENISDLLNALLNEKYTVSVETNGSIPIHQNNMVNWIIDYKLPSSGMTYKMKWDMFCTLPKTAWVKFVCSSLEDLIHAMIIKKELNKRGITNIAVSPVLGKIDAAKIIAYLQAHKHFDVVFSLQIHKFIWPYGEKEK